MPPNKTEPVPEPQVTTGSSEVGSSRPAGGKLDIARWPKGRKLLASVICLLLPPLGLMWIIYALVMFIRKAAWRTGKHVLWLVIILVVTLAGSYGYWWAHYEVYGASHKYSYTYTSLNDYKLASTLKGTSISFKKPTEFIVSGKAFAQQGSSYADLYQPNYKTTPVSGLGYLSVSLVQSALAGSPDYLKSLGSTLANPNDKNYQKVVKPINDFVVNTYNPVYKVTLDPAQTLKTANLTANAWQFDYTVLNDKNQHEINPLRGKVVFAAGKHTFYYFLVSSVDYNWNKNMTTWNQVVDSIKIDQE